jgi:hypothetical protein
MDLPVIPLFPHGALDSAVITTVWVGVAVVAFFNLRLGWVLSGLVVPGYMVPLLILKPWSAAVVFLEGFVTYGLVWCFSDVLARLGYWSSLFGRDRFFALVLASVTVRLLFDGWLLPGLGRWLTEELGLVFDYRNNLHSFGLVIIALIANQFWKTGLLRGLLPMTVTIGITYLIVRYGLMTLTNFTISSMSYMYEDIASSILAGPKAYVILLTVAFVASRMNLIYGWDFSGILIPSLLALQWYEPVKVVMTFLEALLILAIARALLQTRWFRNSTMEGARKLLLFFNINFVYKLLLAYLLLFFFPGVKVTDSYAFGYLLATLIAIKMYDKDIAVRLTRAALQTSLVGVALASLIGFALTLLPTASFLQGPATASATAARVQPLPELISDRLRDDKLMLYRAEESGPTPHLLTSELQAFTRAIELIDAYRRDRAPQQLDQAADQLATLGYELLQLEGHYLYLRETAPVRGWGMYVIDTTSRNRLVVEVPAPLDERGTFEAGTSLFVNARAGALAIAGSRRTSNSDGAADVLHNRETLFHAFHHALSRRDALQVRGYTVETVRKDDTSREQWTAEGMSALQNTLWVNSELPTGLNLASLKKLLGGLAVEWRPLPGGNRQRESTRRGFAELVVNEAAIRRLRARFIRPEQEPRLQVSDQRIDGYLQEWLLGSKQQIAPEGSNGYRTPATEQLLYFDEEIVTPLLRAVDRYYREGDWSVEGLEEIRTIQAAAASFGYRSQRYRHSTSGQDYLILFEDESLAVRRFWGTYVFRLGNSQGYVVQVPRPLFEVNSFEYGVALFERLKARALLIAGAHPNANLDGSANLVSLEHFNSLFSLVSQVILREAGDAPMMIVHSRGMGYRPDSPLPETDVLLSFAEGTFPDRGENVLTRGLLAALQADGLNYQYVDGRPETAGYEVGNVPQSLYLDATINKGFGVLWLTPEVRTAYRQQDENRQEQLRFSSLGIASQETDLERFIAEHASTSDGRAVPAGLRRRLARYQSLADIVTLRSLQVEWPGYSWQRLVDRNSKQSFLAVFDRRQQLCVLANLNPQQPDRVFSITTGKHMSSRVREFINARAALLEFGA